MKELISKISILFAMSFTIVLLLTPNSSAFESYYRNDSFTMASKAKDPYFKNIQPILDKRCVACHSCRESECQLKLTSPEGLKRGGTKQLVHGTALNAIVRNKLFEDAFGEEKWRQRGFYSVLDLPDYLKGFTEYRESPDRGASILSAALSNKLSNTSEDYGPNLLGTEAQSCGDGNVDLANVPGMPYRMAPLEFNSEFLPLYDWAAAGSEAYFPSKAVIKEMTTPNNPELIKKWENFFNTPTKKAQWTSRFLYEHLFLSRFYFEQAPGEFFELIRSATESPQDIELLPTNHAWESPGKKRFFYRLRKIHSSIVFKNHMVYRVN
ncbi:MAG: hypothetical protein HOM21_04115, partial [Halobacteriovoraceae bacterium]|nr:hypothetical protein [Halobacteriovoraceae bacterium]